MNDSISYHIFPGLTETWEDFLKKYPPYSIALDGFLSSPTAREPSGPRANFDHHTGVDRMACRSTSDQIALEIMQGLFETFKKDGRPHAHLYVNDCDEDTVLSIWLLKNHELLWGPHAHDILRLVYLIDRLDTTSGGLFVGDRAMLGKIAWIFEPYQRPRAERRLGELKEAPLMQRAIDEIMRRLGLYARGEALEAPIKDGYRILKAPAAGGGYAIIEEEGPLARQKLYEKGVGAFLSSLGGGRYVLGRRSDWIPFPLEKIYARLNELDPRAARGNEWGGSDMIGGSPRLRESGLSLGEISAAIDEILAKET